MSHAVLSVEDAVAALKKAVSSKANAQLKEDVGQVISTVNEVGSITQLSSELCRRLSYQLREGLQPVYPERPTHSLNLASAIFHQIVHQKTGTLLPDAHSLTEEGRKRWDHVARNILSGVHDFLEAHETDATKHVIGRLLFPTLCDWAFPEDASLIPGITPILRSTAYGLLEAAAFNNIQNRRRLRNLKIVTPERIGSAIAVTHDYLTLEGLLNVLDRALPGAGEQKKRDAFLQQLFSRACDLGCRDELVDILHDAPHDWEEQRTMVINVLASNDILFPHPFQVLRVNVCGNQGLQTSDSLIVDRSSCLIDVLKDKFVNSLEFAHSSVRAITVEPDSQGETSHVIVNLASPPLMDGDEISLAQGGRCVFEFDLWTTDLPRFNDALGARGLAGVFVNPASLQISPQESRPNPTFSPAIAVWNPKRSTTKAKTRVSFADLCLPLHGENDSDETMFPADDVPDVRQLHQLEVVPSSQPREEGNGEEYFDYDRASAPNSLIPPPVGEGTAAAPTLAAVLPSVVPASVPETIAKLPSNPEPPQARPTSGQELTATITVKTSLISQFVDPVNLVNLDQEQLATTGQGAWLSANPVNPATNPRVLANPTSDDPLDIIISETDRLPAPCRFSEDYISSDGETSRALIPKIPKGQGVTRDLRVPTPPNRRRTRAETKASVVRRGSVAQITESAGDYEAIFGVQDERLSSISNVTSPSPSKVISLSDIPDSQMIGAVEISHLIREASGGSRHRRKLPSNNSKGDIIVIDSENEGDHSYDGGPTRSVRAKRLRVLSSDNGASDPANYTESSIGRDVQQTSERISSLGMDRGKILVPGSEDEAGTAPLDAKAKASQVLRTKSQRGSQDEPRQVTSSTFALSKGKAATTAVVFSDDKRTTIDEDAGKDPVGRAEQSNNGPQLGVQSSDTARSGGTRPRKATAVLNPSGIKASSRSSLTSKHQDEQAGIKSMDAAHPLHIAPSEVALDFHFPHDDDISEHPRILSVGSERRKRKRDITTNNAGVASNHSDHPHGALSAVENDSHLSFPPIKPTPPTTDAAGEPEPAPTAEDEPRPAKKKRKAPAADTTQTAAPLPRTRRAAQMAKVGQAYQSAARLADSAMSPPVSRKDDLPPQATLQSDVQPQVAKQRPVTKPSSKAGNLFDHIPSPPIPCPKPPQGGGPEISAPAGIRAGRMKDKQGNQPKPAVAFAKVRKAAHVKVASVPPELDQDEQSAVQAGKKPRPRPVAKNKKARQDEMHNRAVDLTDTSAKTRLDKAVLRQPSPVNPHGSPVEIVEKAHVASEGEVKVTLLRQPRTPRSSPEHRQEYPTPETVTNSAEPVPASRVGSFASSAHGKILRSHKRSTGKSRVHAPWSQMASTQASAEVATSEPKEIPLQSHSRTVDGNHNTEVQSLAEGNEQQDHDDFVMEDVVDGYTRNSSPAAEVSPDEPAEPQTPEPRRSRRTRSESPLVVPDSEPRPGSVDRLQPPVGSPAPAIVRDEDISDGDELQAGGSIHSLPQRLHSVGMRVDETSLGHPTGLLETYQQKTGTRPEKLPIVEPPRRKLPTVEQASPYTRLSGHEHSAGLLVQQLPVSNQVGFAKPQTVSVNKLEPLPRGPYIADPPQEPSIRAEASASGRLRKRRDEPGAVTDSETEKISKVLDDIHAVLKERLATGFEEVKKDALIARTRVLRVATEDLQVLRNDYVEKYNSLVDLEEEYRETGKKLLASQERVKASHERVHAIINKAINTHDRRCYSKKLPKSLASRPVPAVFQKYLGQK